MVFHRALWFGLVRTSRQPSERRGLRAACCLHPHLRCSLMNKIGVGDPAASSLSSCLCAFPGGVSLLTETGLLRPFLVSNASQEGYAAEATTVAAATPVCLSKPSPEGSFPVGRDVPVDHAWSRGGHVLVVLHRSSFAAYARELDASLLSQRCPSTDERTGDSSRAQSSSRTRPGCAAPSLGLVEAYVGSNGFDGKVVACCLLGVSATAARSSVCSEGDECGSGKRRTYLIAVGGTSGVECHALELELGRREESGSEERKRTRKRGDAAEDESKPTAAPGVTCRPLTNIFQGYLVVALAFSPDSGLMAAAAMTGHVKVWDVAALAVPPPPPPPRQPPRKSNSSSIPARKGPAARGGRGGGKKKGFDEAARAMRPRSGRAESSAPPALWGLALPMARATSLSFSPDDNATFALACWDGKIALFLPTAAGEAAVSPPSSQLSETRKDTTQGGSGGGGGGRNKGIGGRRTWEQLWRATASAAPRNLEDQDGAFLCWCEGSEGSDAPTPGLAVSAYNVTTGDCLVRQRCEEENRNDRAVSSSSRGGVAPTPTTDGVPPAVTTGPGFELFAGDGLGETVGGAVSGSRPAGLTGEPTAERYLIHGLAAGPGFVALYDSELCLHVVSLAAILGAGRVLPPPPPPPPPRPTASAAVFPAVEDTGTSSLADAAGAEATASLLVRTVTLVNNDHGLVAACVRRHRGSEGDGVGKAAQSEDGLELLITWRNATSGVETLDNGECVGRESGGGDRRLPFLPGELADDEGGVVGGNGGVFGADVRWGRVALFTRYSVLVYTHPRKGGAAGTAQEVKGGNAVAAARLEGGWSAYAETPVVHGLLLGGASTAAPFSQRLPEPPTNLTNTYLLTVLGTGGEAGGRGPLLSIRSLCDRSVSCRCPLIFADDGDDREAGLVESNRGLKVYASPGYGGGVFAVAAEGGQGECAKVWRGTFDEGSSRLELGPSRVITSYPWPEPETLRLQGVAGPNCELFLFKEERDSQSGRFAKAGGSGNVRWWITWPEAEIWRWVDAPALVGEEDLGISDFVKIFQLEVEEMMSSYSRHGADDGPPTPP